MFTITPGRDSVASILETTARVMNVGPSRFTASTFRHASVDSVVTAPVSRSCLTRRPSRPVDERRAGVLVAHVEALAMDGRGQGGQVLVVDVADGHGCTRLVETAREVGTHAAGASGDDDLQLVQLHVYRFSQSARDG
jgi:hypothetical protein